MNKIFQFHEKTFLFCLIIDLFIIVFSHNVFSCLLTFFSEKCLVIIFHHLLPRKLFQSKENLSHVPRKLQWNGMPVSKIWLILLEELFVESMNKVNYYLLKTYFWNFLKDFYLFILAYSSIGNTGPDSEDDLTAAPEIIR